VTRAAGMKKKYFFIPGFAMLLLLAAAAWQVRIVQVVLPRKGDQQIAVVLVSPSDIIKLCYRHSNELIQVEGRFSIDDQSRSVFLKGRQEKANGWWWMK